MARYDAENWGELPDGRTVAMHTLAAGALVMRVCDFGCTIVSLNVPDRRGRIADVVLGYDALAQYFAGGSYFGCVVGRFANRIARGRFSLGRRKYRLATNNAPGGIPCHLHGGFAGFDKALWSSTPIMRDGAIGVQFAHRSPAGDEGYPGNLDVRVSMLISEGNELILEYEARCDGPTVVNLSNHSYFNLCGHAAGVILGHELAIAASKFTPVNRGLIPTGAMRYVRGTPFDFRRATAIGMRIDAKDRQIECGQGYDHNFVLNGPWGELRSVARVHEPRSGRCMEVLTTQPGLQFYSGNFLNGGEVGKGGCRYLRRSGFCLETQHFPDSPNQPRFPSVVLRPGATYRERTIYRFSTK